MSGLPSPGRLVVVSPHLDDAALSLGATLAHLASRGLRITVLTVFAGDPQSTAEAGPWDRRAGFATAATAALARREEDRRACSVLGVEPIWLDHADEQYNSTPDADAVWLEIEPILEHAELVLVPGHPLANRDHAWLHAALLAHADEANFALYVEQPYASDLAIGRELSLRPVVGVARLAIQTRLKSLPDRNLGFGANPRAQLTATWRAIEATRRARAQKAAAVGEYVSQLRPLGGQMLRSISLYETIVGGEQIGLFGNPTKTTSSIWSLAQRARPINARLRITTRSRS